MLTLERWTPLRELDRMERRLRRVFEDVGVFPPLVPAADVIETEKEFVLELEVPGFAKDELDVEVSDHTLVVKGEREAETEKDISVVLHERLEREFVRRFELPLGADGEHVEAAYDKGVLTLHVPKTAAKETRKVEIGV